MEHPYARFNPMGNFFAALLFAALAAVWFLAVPEACAQRASHVVISEVYGGGGNSGSTWKNDFVELYNPTDLAVSLEGWSIQYASASASSWQVTPLSGSIQPKSFFLIQQAAGTGGSRNLPTPDVIGAIAMAQSNGHVALSREAAPVTGNADPTVVDFVGYGTARLFEGSGGAAAISNTSSAERKASAASSAATMQPDGPEERAGNGWDTNDNANDFIVQPAINPQNSQSQKEPPGAILAGIGTAAFVPSASKIDAQGELTLLLRGTSEGTITVFRLIKNTFFDWSGAAIRAYASGGGPPLTTEIADTITIHGISIGASDTLVVRISGITAPDTTLNITFRVETGAGSDSTAPLAQLPGLLVYGAPRPVASVKVNDAQGVPVNLQHLMTVRGIVTVTTQFGGPAYLQDVSGGLAVFDDAFEHGVQVGDEVTITGAVSQYSGLTELTNVTLHSVHSRANVVAPLPVTCAQIATDGLNGFEQYEGMLVQIKRVNVHDTLGGALTNWAVSANQSGANFRLTDATGGLIVRIDRDVNLNGDPVPTGEFDIIGIVGQYITASPFVGGYQLMPRWRSDVLAQGPMITTSPVETNLSATGFTVVWETAKPGSSFLRYGRTPAYELGEIGTQTVTTTHRLVLSGLMPATAYHVKAFSVSGEDTSYANDRMISTASEGSSGTINVYFNKSIRAGVARGEIANGNSDLTSLLLRRIQNAQKSIDAAFYSLSGQPGQAIAQALIEANNRGVAVRCIVERDNLSASTGSTMGSLTSAGVAWIADDYDRVNAGAGLQHNKFFVFDCHHASADQAWVWTGSWNPTDPGTNSDLQNAIEIQDKALAGAFRLEFNEMWGSDSALPHQASSRFGARKTDNTPHVFNINGTPVEVYFSPSDRTTSRISATLARSWHSLNVSLLTFTRSELASLLKAKKDDGVRVHALMENSTDQGSQYDYLRSSGVDVLLDINPGLLHHKYAIIDAEVNGATQYVITGSHNWTNAAENSNNENTLIIQSNRIANLYLQEFAARYTESGGRDVITVGVNAQERKPVGSFQLDQNFPNPFNPTTTIPFELREKGFVRLTVYNMLGQPVATLVEGSLEAGVHQTRWNASEHSTGVYYYEVLSNGERIVRPMILMK